MQVYQIVLLVLLAVLVITTSVFYASYRAMLKSGTQYITVGTVQYFQKGKIPFLGTAVIRYTKKGKPYQAQTNTIPVWKQPKTGAMGMYTIISCATQKGRFVQARLHRSKNHKQ